MKLLRSIKAQLIVFLCCFALFLVVKDKDKAFLFSMFLAVITAVGSELIIKFIRERVLVFNGSSFISGLIIGFVLSSDNHWWVIVLASIFAIVSKEIISFKKKHIFNPAALGIFIVMILFGATTHWKGTYLWYFLAPFGIYFAFKIRKTELLISYFLVSFILFGTQVLMHKAHLFSVFGLLSYFYIFIMLVEPKTTPVNFFGKVVFAAGAGVLIFILTAAGVKFDVELFSLLAVNMFVPLLNKLR